MAHFRRHMVARSAEEREGERGELKEKRERREREKKRGREGELRRMNLKISETDSISTEMPKLRPEICSHAHSLSHQNSALSTVLTLTLTHSHTPTLSLICSHLLRACAQVSNFIQIKCCADFIYHKISPDFLSILEFALQLIGCRRAALQTAQRR